MGLAGSRIGLMMMFEKFFCSCRCKKLVGYLNGMLFEIAITFYEIVLNDCSVSKMNFR